LTHVLCVTSSSPGTSIRECRTRRTPPPTPAPSSAPGTGTRALAVHDLARLAPATARKLHGQRALFPIALGSTEDEFGGLVLYDCAGPDDDVLRSVRLLPDHEIADDMIVEATLRVRPLPNSSELPSGYPGFPRVIADAGKRTSGLANRGDMP
jgi:hypothetical protein